jgi:hypothetical protein
MLTVAENERGGAGTICFTHAWALTLTATDAASATSRITVLCMFNSCYEEKENEREENRGITLSRIIFHW